MDKNTLNATPSLLSGTLAYDLFLFVNWPPGPGAIRSGSERPGRKRDKDLQQRNQRHSRKAKGTDIKMGSQELEQTGMVLGAPMLKQIKEALINFI